MVRRGEGTGTIWKVKKKLGGGGGRKGEKSKESRRNYRGRPKSNLEATSSTGKTQYRFHLSGVGGKNWEEKIYGKGGKKWEQDISVPADCVL